MLWIVLIAAFLIGTVFGPAIITGIITGANSAHKSVSNSKNKQLQARLDELEAALKRKEE